MLRSIEIKIDHRRRVEREHLTQCQPADRSETQRFAQLRRSQASGAAAERAAMVVIRIGQKRSRQA
jgi:hypothetical protein